MFEAIYDQFFEYTRFYQKYAITWWDHIGPTEYVWMLSIVGIIGYVSMLRTSKVS